MKHLWMPLYVADYLADTRGLSTVQHGAYMLLIMEYWRKGRLPDDEEELARIAGLSDDEWARHRPRIRRLFLDGEGWRHKRVEEELQKAAAKSDAARQSGSIGGKAKWGSPSSDAAKRSERLSAARKLATHTKDEWVALVAFCGGKCVRCQKSGCAVVKDHIQPIYAGGSDGIENLQPLCTSCNSSKGPDQTDFRPDGWRSSVETAVETAVEMPSERLANHNHTSLRSECESDARTRMAELNRKAEEFYDAYPKKVNPIEAKKKFISVVRSGHDADKVIAATKRFAEAHRLAGTDKQFIPAGAVWLNKGGWQSEDLPEARAGPPKNGNTVHPFPESRSHVPKPRQPSDVAREFAQRLSEESRRSDYPQLPARNGGA